MTRLDPGAYAVQLATALVASDGEAVLTAFAAIPFEIIPSLPRLPTASRLRADHRQMIYDALFLALSLAMDADFVTADEAFHQAVRPSFPRVRCPSRDGRGSQGTSS